MKLNILNEAIERCLDEMYRYAQPSITFEEIKQLGFKEVSETRKPQPIYQRFYLSNEEYKIIEEKYIDAYKLCDHFNEHCELIMRDMEKGCSKDKYIKETDDTPGYRGYESVPSLDNEIGKDNLNKVLDFIKMRINFYRMDKDEQSFRFNIMNFAPCCNKETVINYWKSQGKDIKIEDRDNNDMWEVHYYGLTWDEWNEEHKDIKEIKKEIKHCSTD